MPEPVLEVEGALLESESNALASEQSRGVRQAGRETAAGAGAKVTQPLLPREPKWPARAPRSLAQSPNQGCGAWLP